MEEWGWFVDGVALAELWGMNAHRDGGQSREDGSH